ncbi:MAG: ABC transporter ATP-binding protein [Anaerolineaceae bacterium]|nr:ABC transporter ATP-binding protein [Anaerolineaceae bacterium]MBN2677296.1 ABC transporter ATP-binding protein [Anaerolineaceae bacterium]
MRDISNKMSGLGVERLTKYYNHIILLNHISFEVRDQEVLCLLGPSGSGKSTLLRIIAGLESFESGLISWHGNNLDSIPTEKRKFGLMFQDYALFPHLNVFDNVAFGLRMQGLPKEKIIHKVSQALARVNMSDFVKRKVQTLSGGEQQRIALARTLAPDPKLIMLDEPLGALDRKLREQLCGEIRQILRSNAVPAIYVTHDQEEAFSIADRILIISEGKIQQIGTPQELFLTPASSWVARFLGLGNVIQGEISSLQPLTIHTILGNIECTDQAVLAKPQKGIELLIRPNSVKLVSGKSAGFNGLVLDSVFQGERYETTVRVQDKLFKFDLPTSCTPGTSIQLTVKQEGVTLFTSSMDQESIKAGNKRNSKPKYQK